MKFQFKLAILIFTVSFLTSPALVKGQSVLSPSDLLRLKTCQIIDFHPDGKELIYSTRTPRTANDSAGPARVEYHKMIVKDGISTPLFDANEKGSSPAYSPDGKMIAFIRKKGEGKQQVWAMPSAGGEIIQMSKAKNDISSFEWLPVGQGIIYSCLQAKTEKEKELQKRGYDFIFYEENLKNNELFLSQLDKEQKIKAEKQLTKNMHVWDFKSGPHGKLLAFSASEKNLIDFRYMFREIYILELSTGKIIHQVENVGKLGNYSFSPDGKVLAYTSALNINDHAVSQVYTYSLEERKNTNHTPENFKGHFSWVAWKNNNELLCYSGEGVYPKLSIISLNGNQPRKILLDAADAGVIFGTPLFTKDFRHFVFTGNTPVDISNIYSWDGKEKPVRISDLNPELQEKQLGKQEVFRYKARDGMEIDGILMHPPGYTRNKKYPLIMYVHGGPESHHSNGWLSRYSTPGQVMAGKGYLVAYTNYRASTGYGVDFGMEGFMDPAGKEFDDLADGIEYLIREKGADRERVGMAGGSYGGYASGWFATYYTKYVKAVCMFVGISNVVSKKGTTDIPYEELLVHSGKPLEEQWQMNLERSPVFWAHRSKTATLIYGGANDTRVHPSQSMELYRRMKMNDHPAVRLVQYPGEGHGNRKQVGQIDVLYRQIDWLDWYVKDKKSLHGPMPPLDISDKYGLNWNLNNN